jgi:protein-S-isoprenylcysteine O-methyltransferase Ste14
VKRKFAVVVGALSLVYMFVPEPTDVIPVLGWLDEGVAGALLLWSMRTLGVSPGDILGRMRGKPRSEVLAARVDN